MRIGIHVISTEPSVNEVSEKAWLLVTQQLARIEAEESKIGMVNWRKTRMRIEIKMEMDGIRICPALRRRGVPNQLERRAA